jgi:hypothetical protein
MGIVLSTAPELYFDAIFDCPFESVQFILECLASLWCPRTPWPLRSPYSDEPFSSILLCTLPASASAAVRLCRIDFPSVNFCMKRSEAFTLALMEKRFLARITALYRRDFHKNS